MAGTFFDYLKRQRELSPKTRERYERTARRWEDTRATPEGWLKRHITSSTPPNTANVLIAAARHYATWEGRTLDLAGVPKIRGNPSEGFKRVGLNEAELADYELVVTDAPEPYRTILQLLPLTGTRIGEITSLRQEGVTMRGRRPGIEVLGKGQKLRWVPLTTDGVELIRDYVDAEAPDGPWLFPSPQSSTRHVSPGSVRKHLRELRKNMNGYARQVTPHILRHTCATMLMQEDVPLRVVQAILGHQSMATTAMYQHPSADDLADAMERL